VRLAWRLLASARTLAPSPIRDQLHRRLQPFRHLHDCSGCFRLERSPGGTCTHWKAPPSHGARKQRSFPWWASNGLEFTSKRSFAARSTRPDAGRDRTCRFWRQTSRILPLVGTWRVGRSARDVRSPAAELSDMVVCCPQACSRVKSASAPLTSPVNHGYLKGVVSPKQ
jgi:hypothetical protein